MEIERISAKAWSEGGAEGEKAAREEYQIRKTAQIKSYTTRGRELTEEYSTRRKAQMKLMLAELQKDKEVMIKKREDLKALYKTIPDDEE